MPTHQELQAIRSSPLVRVLCQVRWPELSNFDVEDVAGRLEVTLGQDYPLKRRSKEMQLIVTPDGVRQDAGNDTFQYESADRGWLATLTTSSIALETKRYRGHGEFLERMRALVQAVAEIGPVPVWDRVGYRYTNRLSGADLQAVPVLFTPQAHGLLPAPGEGTLIQSVTESVMQPDVNSMLLTRSAYVPANALIDPTVPPADTPSWYLDLDAYTQVESEEFDLEGLLGVCERLSGIAGEYFRESVTDAFIERYSR